MRATTRWWLVKAAAVVTVTIAFATSEAAATPPIPYSRGVVVGEWGKTAYHPRPTERLLRRLARRHGVDSVTLFVDWLQRDSSSTTLRPGEKTAPTANLVHAIRFARSLDMRVTLRPYFDIERGGWRGLIRPASVSRWFASYQRFILRYARLAEREEVSMVEIGSEMRSLSGLDSRWRSLIEQVRRAYGGFITYNANWDEAESVRWWDAVDVISVSAYFPLSTNPNPSLQDLTGGWGSLVRLGGRETWFQDLDRLRMRFGKDVRFGEIGYRPVAETAMFPWESRGGTSNHRAQSRAYEAAFRVWYPVPWFKGFSWWFMPPQPRLIKGKQGADHMPSSGALAAVRKWHRKRR